MKVIEMFSEDVKSKVEMFIEKDILQMELPLFVFDGIRLDKKIICSSDVQGMFSFRGQDMNLASVIKLVNTILSQAKEVEKEIAKFDKELLNIGNVSVDVEPNKAVSTTKEVVVEVLEFI